MSTWEKLPFLLMVPFLALHAIVFWFGGPDYHVASLSFTLLTVLVCVAEHLLHKQALKAREQKRAVTSSN